MLSRQGKSPTPEIVGTEIANWTEIERWLHFNDPSWYRIQDMGAVVGMSPLNRCRLYAVEMARRNAELMNDVMLRTPRYMVVTKEDMEKISASIPRESEKPPVAESFHKSIKSIMDVVDNPGWLDTVVNLIGPPKGKSLWAMNAMSMIEEDNNSNNKHMQESDKKEEKLSFKIDGVGTFTVDGECVITMWRRSQSKSLGIAMQDGAYSVSSVGSFKELITFLNGASAAAERIDGGCHDLRYTVALRTTLNKEPTGDFKIVDIPVEFILDASPINDHRIPFGHLNQTLSLKEMFAQWIPAFIEEASVCVTKGNNEDIDEMQVAVAVKLLPPASISMHTRDGWSTYERSMEPVSDTEDTEIVSTRAALRQISLSDGNGSVIVL